MNVSFLVLSHLASENLSVLAKGESVVVLYPIIFLIWAVLVTPRLATVVWYKAYSPIRKSIYDSVKKETQESAITP